jgi:replicative DNA helicase
LGRDTKTLTQDIYNAESAVIGGLMLYPEECSVALEELSSNDFENRYAAEIFEKCLVRKNNNEPIDTAILISTLEDEETRKYALLCAQTFLSTANYDGYIDTIKSESGRRRVTEALNEALYSKLGYADMLNVISKIADSENANVKHDERDYLVDYIKQLYETVKPTDRIRTGFSRLDKSLGGLRKGSLCYIGAYPSTGKTSFAINVAMRNTDKRIQFFSLEMSKDQILDRWFSCKLKIDYNKIDEKKLTEAEQNQIMAEVNALFEQNRISILDDVYSIEAIAAKIARYKPDLVIIDFLQNIRAAGKFASRKNQVDYISAELKRLARVNHCTIITLSQLSRPGADSKSKKPTMTSLKESGNLEADGDYIMLMYRPYVIDKSGQYQPEQTEILLDKNKYGKCGVVDMRFNGQYQQFTEVESRYD